MNIQEIIDRLGKCAVDLDALCGWVRFAVNTHNDICVQRNGDIVGLSYVDTHEARLSSIDRMLREAALSDADACNSLKHTSGQLAVLARDIRQAQSDATSVWSKQAEELAEAKAKLSALEFRLREHALHSEVVRERVWAITDGKCFYCDVELVRGPDCQGERANVFHIDHLVPKAAGGPDHISNYVPSCQSCNIAKGDKPFAEFTRKPAAPKLTVVA